MDNSDEFKKALQIFYIKAFASEFSKIIIFFILFKTLKLEKEFFTALFFLFLFRTNSGGIHCNHYLSCLILSLFILIFDILLGVKFFIPKFCMIFICIMSGTICFILSPIQARTRPPATKTLIKKAKSRTLLIIILFILLLIFNDVSTFTNIGFWMLVVHTFQLILAHIMLRR